jgi:hypothetical protein
MILFYSEFCNHCNLLLETIKRHDTNRLVKLVSIDLLRNLNKKIDPRIQSVPALLFPNTKEIIFGKQVFDHLLLPNRGILFTSKITRDKTDEDKINIKLNIENNTDEPLAFSLGSIVSENYANINDDDNNSINTIDDKNYRWTSINGEINDNKMTNIEINNNGNNINNGNNGNNINNGNNGNNINNGNNGNNGNNSNNGNKNKLPTIEEIMQSREKDIR